MLQSEKVGSLPKGVLLGRELRVGPTSVLPPHPDGSRPGQPGTRLVQCSAREPFVSSGCALTRRRPRDGKKQVEEQAHSYSRSAGCIERPEENLRVVFPGKRRNTTFHLS